MSEGHNVAVMDNFITGNYKNIAQHQASERFEFYHHNVSNHIHVPGPLDWVIHFASPASPVDYLTLPIETLKEKDPNFNEQVLLEKVGNQYIQMQNAWQNKDWEPMRAIMTDALYNQMARQLQALIDAKQTNFVERIAVLETRIVRYAIEADNDVLVVRLSTRITDYTQDDRTGSIINGSMTRELFMVYDWKLIRQKDKKTLNQPSVTQISCPNCGAPLDINHTGKCPYCGTIVTLGDHDWALSVIKGISQKTVG